MQQVLVIVQVADTCRPYRIHGPGIEVLGYRDTQKGEEGGGVMAVDRMQFNNEWITVVEWKQEWNVMSMKNKNT